MNRYLLQQNETGTRLVDRCSHQHPLLIDFAAPAYRRRLKKGGASKELLAKAVGVRPGLTVLDCTAGLGRDSFLLAYLGCNVTMLERSRVMYLLLNNALERAALNDELRETAKRLELRHGNAQGYLSGLASLPDVAIIDPMFPTRKKSASVKGEMQFLQRFVGKDEDAEALLRVTLQSGVSRIVLKRPIHASVTSDLKPSFSQKGKSSRFDVFLQ